MDKANRLLVGGNIAVTYASPAGDLSALVLGDSDQVWLVQRRAEDGKWLCQCPSFAYRGRCSHVQAVYLIASLVQNSAM